MATQPQKKAETRQRILDAADVLSAELGANRLSLEAVAARAGISKGGLLYHFPTKHALLRGLVAMYVDAMRDQMQAIAPDCLSPDGPALQGALAYLTVSGHLICQKDAPMSGVLAAMAEDAGFLAPMLAFRDEIGGVFARCPDAAQARLVFLAAQGVVHLCMTDPTRYARQDVAQMFHDLEVQLAKGQNLHGQSSMPRSS